MTRPRPGVTIQPRAAHSNQSKRVTSPSWSAVVCITGACGPVHAKTALAGPRSLTGQRQPEMLPGRRRGHPAARRAGDQARPHQEGLGDDLDGLGLLPHRDGQRRQADRAAAEAAHERAKHRQVEPVQPALVHLVQFQRRPGAVPGHDAIAAHLGEVAHAAQQPVGDTRRPPGPAGDLVGAVVAQRHAEQAGRPAHDDAKLVRLVEIEVRRETEPVPQRCWQQSGPGSGAHEGELRDVQRDRSGTRPLADHHVYPEVLHGQVQQFLGGPGHPVNLVDEDDIALGQGRQDRG